MQSFLNWIFAKANLIYLWFGDQYNALYEGAHNAWNWAVSRANEAYNNAVSFANNIGMTARALVTNLQNWTNGQLATIRNGIYEDITNVYDWIDYRLSLLQSIQLPDFQGMLNDALAWVYSIPDSIQSWVTGELQSLQSWVWDIFGETKEGNNHLQGLINALPYANFEWLAQFINKDYPLIRQFLSDPLNFIFDLLAPRFITFLCFVLASALGTTKHDLPSQPTYKER